MILQLVFAILVGYYYLLLVAVLESVRMVQAMLLVYQELAIPLERVAVGYILEVVATVAVLSEHNVFDTVLYRRCIVLAEISLQLVNLSLRRFARLVKLLVVKVLVIASAALCIIDDVVCYCHVVLADFSLVVVSYCFNVSINTFSHNFPLAVMR